MGYAAIAVHSGHIDAEAERELVEGLRFGEWDQIAKEPQGCLGGDTGGAHLEARDYRISICHGDGELGALRAAGEALIVELYAAGEPVTGRLALGVRQLSPEEHPDVTFHAAGELEALVLSTWAALNPDLGSYSVVVVEDADVTERLRALRSAEHGEFIPLSAASGERYEVYARDLHPYETLDGSPSFEGGP